MKIPWTNRIPLTAILVAIMIMGITGKGFSRDQVPGKIVQLNENDREALTILGEGVVGKALPARPIKNTAGLMPLREGKWTYQITAGNREGTQQTASISRTHRKNEPILWHRTIKGDYTEFFSVQSNGAVNLASEMDLKQGVITHYDPMFPVMFDGMGPGDKSQVETEIKVYDLHDPAFLKYSGHLTVTHTYVGAYEVTVPAGKYSARLIKSSYVGKVGPAHVVDGSYVFYAENVGMVASVERMHVTAFLFYDKHTKTPKVLIQKGRDLSGVRPR